MNPQKRSLFGRNSALKKKALFWSLFKNTLISCFLDEHSSPDVYLPFCVQPSTAFWRAEFQFSDIKVKFSKNACSEFLMVSTPVYVKTSNVFKKLFMALFPLIDPFLIRGFAY